MKVLIAVDSEPCSQEVLKLVASYKWSADTNFKVLTVLKPFDIGDDESESEFLKAMRDRQRKKAQDNLDKAVAFLSENLTECKIEGILKIDANTTDTIIELAEHNDCSLIVIGSHNKVGLQRLFMGSVSSSVMLKASCSVLIVKSEKQHKSDNLNILAAFDGSEYGDKIIKSIVERPWAKGTTFKFVTVLESTLHNLTQENPIEILHEISDRETLELRSQNYLSKLANQVKEKVKDINVEVEVLEGEPKEVILKILENWPANHVMLGSRGRNGFERLLLGSVSHAVASYCHCHVEIVR